MLQTSVGGRSCTSRAAKLCAFWQEVNEKLRDMEGQRPHVRGPKEDAGSSYRWLGVC